MSEAEEIEAQEVAGAMKAFGGGFIQCLGEALFHADINNIRNIKTTWSNTWKHYASLAKMAKERKETAQEGEHGTTD